MTAANTSIEVLSQSSCCMIDIGQEDGVHYSSVK